MSFAYTEDIRLVYFKNVEKFINVFTFPQEGKMSTKLFVSALLAIFALTISACGPPTPTVSAVTRTPFPTVFPQIVASPTSTFTGGIVAAESKSVELSKGEKVSFRNTNTNATVVVTFISYDIDPLGNPNHFNARVESNVVDYTGWDGPVSEVAYSEPVLGIKLHANVFERVTVRYEDPWVEVK